MMKEYVLNGRVITATEKAYNLLYKEQGFLPKEKETKTGKANSKEKETKTGKANSKEKETKKED